MKITRKINGQLCDIELTENEMFNAYEEQQFKWDHETAKERLSQSDDDTFDDLTDAQFECVINQVAYEMRRQMDKYGYDTDDALDRAISIVKSMDLTPLYERSVASENDSTCQHLSIEPESDNTVYPASIAEALLVKLDTFPSDNKYYSLSFGVPQSWLINYLKDQKSVSLEEFLETYIWDDTWFVYLQALQDDVLIYERNQK